MTAAVDTAEWERVAGMVFGFFPAQVVQTVARLGVPDALGVPPGRRASTPPR